MDLGETSSQYQAPQWIPDGILHVSGDRLVLADTSGGEETLARMPGPATFIANSSGNHVALQAIGVDVPALQAALQPIPEIAPNKVVLLEPATGTVTEVTDEPSIGFFWSPDGRKLLILLPTGEPGEVALVVWEEGRSTELARYIPALSFLQSVLPFFGQYAQSYQLWSPTSDAVTFAGRIGADEGIWVQSLDGSAPAFVSPGGWVAWSNS